MWRECATRFPENIWEFGTAQKITTKLLHARFIFDKLSNPTLLLTTKDNDHCIVFLSRFGLMIKTLTEYLTHFYSSWFPVREKYFRPVSSHTVVFSFVWKSLVPLWSSRSKLRNTIRFGTTPLMWKTGFTWSKISPCKHGP